MNAADFVVHTDVLDDATCWRLLARAWVGRVGFTDGPSAVSGRITSRHRATITGIPYMPPD